MQSLIREVGIKRIVKYFFYSLWQVGFNALLFSPLRILWMQLAGAKIGHNCFIDAIDFFNLDRTGIKGITIGNNCFIGRRVLLDLAGKMELGNYVTIAPNTTILTHINFPYPYCRRQFYWNRQYRSGWCYYRRKSYDRGGHCR